MLDTIFNFIPFLKGIPAAWQVVTLGVSIAPTLGAIVTAGVSFWHALVAIATGIAVLPGCKKAEKVAAWLKIESGKIDADESKLLSVLNRISAIPLPQHELRAGQPAAPVVPAAIEPFPAAPAEPLAQ